MRAAARQSRSFVRVRRIASVLALTAAAIGVTAPGAGAIVAGETAVAITSFRPQQLVTFKTDNPANTSPPVPITGVRRNELIVGIDYRPANRRLYGLGDSGQLYLIDIDTGAADPVGSRLATVNPRRSQGFDFNPVPDRLRLVNDLEDNDRVNVDDGSVTNDGNLAYAPGDPNFGRGPEVSGAGYTNSQEGATSTTLFDIDSGREVLAKQDPPDSGTLNTVGSLGVRTTSEASLDISPNSNTPFAILTPEPGSSPTSRLYRVNTTTGAASEVGQIGSGGRYRALAIAPDQAPPRLELTKIGGINTGAAEISAYDKGSKRLFTTDLTANEIDVFDMSNPAAITPLASIPLAPYGASPNSVAVSRDGVLAVAEEASPKQSPGKVVFFRAATSAFLAQETVGAVPDMVTFTPDGSKALTANEGEPNNYNPGNADPEGTVSIVSAPGAPVEPTRTATFTSFNASPPVDTHGGAPGTTFAQNAEPEYIAVDRGGQKAYVTLQETNAVARVDIATGGVEKVNGLGGKDHSQPGAGLDPSDQDSGININQWPVFGMYQPDAIATYTSRGRTRLVTANEGDARDYPGFAEERRVGNAAYPLDPTAFPNAATDFKPNSKLGRLNATRVEGDTDSDGDFDKIFAFGGRSMSVLDDEGEITDDTGDEIEQLTAVRQPSLFNSEQGNTAEFDKRSDNKGPEPEGVAIGRVGGRQYSFLANERQGSIFAYDLAAAPGEAREAGYLPSTSSDTAPEGVVFIPAADSPTGEPLLVVSYEVSASVAVYRIAPGATP